MSKIGVELTTLDLQAIIILGYTTVRMVYFAINSNATNGHHHVEHAHPVAAAAQPKVDAPTPKRTTTRKSVKKTD